MEARLKRIGLKTLALFICLTGSAASVFSTTVIIPSDDDLIIGARAIVRAKVLSIHSRIAEDDRIFTYITLRVKEVLKGDLAERKIVLKELGGRVGDRGSIVYGNPRFARGEKVLVYLDTWADGSLRTYQMFLGKFNIIKDPQTSASLVVRSAPDENTVILQSRSHEARAARAATERMELADYTRMVRARLSAAREHSEEFEKRHYGGVALLAAPPEYAGASEAGALQPQYTLITSPPPRWFEPDAGAPVVFKINPDGAPNPQSIDDVNAAMNAWSNIPGCSLRVVNGGTMESCYVGTDQSAIVFNNCDGRNAATPFCSGVLAWGGLSWHGSITKTINGTTFTKAREGFVSFNPYAACHYDDHCQVQEIATHELGHALGLGHSQFSDATMAAIAHFDGRCASLRQDDVNGILFLYSATGGGPGPLAIVSGSPLTPAIRNSPYAQTLVASGGALPYNWSIVAGALPSGLVLNANGVISGTAASAGTFNFTARVTDSSSPQAAAQKEFSISVITQGSDYDAAFVSQAVPDRLEPRQAFEVQIKWINTGTRSWDGSAGFRLVTQNPNNNVVWGGNVVNVPGFVVPPAEQLDIRFTAFAPATAGTYNFQWQLFQEGAGYFGQMSANVAIRVGDGDDSAGNNAAFVSQSVPATMTAGQSQIVSVVMKNTGSATWSAGAYKLASQNPQDNTTWGLSRVNLNSPVAPGADATFTFSITAPATAGAYNFQWQLLDEATGYFGQPSANVTVVVSPLASPEINGPASLEMNQGAPFAHQFTASNGAPPYTWSIAGGALPSGISLSQNTGLLSGAPTASGNFAFTIQVTDSQARTAQKAISIVVAAPPLQITTSALPSVMRGAAFNYQLAASGGSEPYTWAIASGALPAGLSIAQSTGVISGVPAASGDFAFDVEVRDSSASAARRSLLLRVMAQPLSIDGGSTVEGSKGLPLSYHINVAGGVPPYTWAITGGALPAGLSLNSNTGAISGVPAASGTFNVTVAVRDQRSESAARSLIIRIVDPETVPVITRVKYQARKEKLTVTGQRIDRNAVLLINGFERRARFNGEGFTMKHASFAAGRHEIRIVNPNGSSSQVHYLDVN